MNDRPLATFTTSVEAQRVDAHSFTSASILTGIALRDVIAERIQQVEVHGYDLNHDLNHDPATIAAGAASYLDTAIDVLQGRSHPNDQPPETWPWEPRAWKPGERRAMLVKAAAMIWAVIDRIDGARDTPPCEIDRSNNAVRCLDRLMAVELPQIPVATIGEVIAWLMRPHGDAETTVHAQFKQCGLRLVVLKEEAGRWAVTGDVNPSKDDLGTTYLAISRVGSRWIEEIFAGTEWCNGAWIQSLARIAGAQLQVKVRFAKIHSENSVVVPLNMARIASAPHD